jgi:hypothetical protein
MLYRKHYSPQEKPGDADQFSGNQASGYTH